jgi:hypothetical protein
MHPSVPPKHHRESAPEGAVSISRNQTIRNPTDVVAEVFCWLSVVAYAVTCAMLGWHLVTWLVINWGTPMIEFWIKIGLTVVVVMTIAIFILIAEGIRNHQIDKVEARYLRMFLLGVLVFGGLFWWAYRAEAFL